MCTTCKFQLKKQLSEKEGHYSRKYQNIKISKQPIAAALNREVDLASSLTDSKKSWMYQLLFFIFNLRYFVDHDLNS